MMSIINRILNLEQLKQRKIVTQLILLHDPKFQTKIRKFWWKWIPQPIPYLKQYLFEGKKYKYNELTVIKNYLGPKHGFYFAFLSFYTTWLIPVAVLGLAITIYAVISKDLDNYVSLSYVFVVMVWLAIVIERWKRKASEISLKWGLTMIKQEDKEVRDGFFGDDRFNF